jgi:N-acetylneuraminate synthase/N,N'-diacetyllegionaminate synthase
MTGKVQVGDKWVGEGERTFIVAEVGSNHDQKLAQAKQLIEATAATGADAVKFQFFSADSLYPPGSESNAVVKQFELPPEWLPDLAAYSKACGLIFFASPFFFEAVDALAEVDVAAYKVASSETTNLPLLKRIAAKGRPVLLSTGLCDLSDVHEAIEAIHSEGNTEIVLYQCTSRYPTEPQYSNLRVMDTLRTAFQVPVGLSDHTLGFVVPVAAVARGACSVEKTFTLSNSLPGPDHSYALEPSEFKKMVEAIRTTEEALGSPIKTMLPEEAEVDTRRDCIRAVRDIEAGEVISNELLTVARPAHGGIRPRYISAILGRKARVSISKGEPIAWENI